MSRNETEAALLTRGRGGGWLVASTHPDGDDLNYEAAASLQEARALANVVAYEQGWKGKGAWRADNGVHRLMFPVDN
jgi:hypothetical protein